MTSPKIGSRVRGSKSGRPIMVALDVLGRRGALRVLWELRGDPLTFRALQDVCETNPGSLNTRLKELRELGIVDHDAGGYRLTEQGRALMTALEPLQDWADQGDRDSRRAALVHPRPSPPQHAFERGPRRHLPAQLGEHPGRNERGDEHCEPDPDHGQHGITGRPEMNRVFPSKKKCFPQLPGDRRDRSHGERVAVLAADPASREPSVGRVAWQSSSCHFDRQ